MLAAEVGAGQAQLMAQAVCQAHARLDRDFHRFPVHFKSHWHTQAHIRRRERL
jgi:hypothetical protein